MRYPAYLEVGPNGWTRGYVFALPGLSVLARTADEALAALPSAIADERARLRVAGRDVPGPDEAIEVVETERIETAADVAGGATRVLFRYELRATREEDVALALDRVALAHDELMRLPGGPKPADLAALADGEWWLLSRLGNRPAGQLPPETEPSARFDAVRALVVQRLTHLLPGDHERHAVFGGEPWTARKVLRRLACLARDTLERARAQARAQAGSPGAALTTLELPPGTR